VLGLLAAGCAGLTSAKPHARFGRLDFETQRKDFVVLNTVEGTSKERSYCFGLVRIVDDHKWQVLGVRFFEDHYATPRGLGFPLWPGTVEARAYYDALSKAPDADAVLEKSSTTKVRGFPFLYREKEVTYRGKAIQLRSD
jgi:hypothetical protein